MRSAFVVVLLFVLTACGQNPHEKAQALLNEGKRDEAIAVLEKAIADGVKDDIAPAINGMAAELLTAKCVAADCPLKDAATLQRIRRYLSVVRGPVQMPDGTTVDVYDRVMRTAIRLISQRQNPESYAAFVTTALPDGAPKSRLTAMLMDEVYAEVAARRADSAQMVLTAIIQTADGEHPVAKLAAYYDAILKGDLTTVQGLAAAALADGATGDMTRVMSAVNFLYMSGILRSEDANAGDGFFNTMLTFFPSFGLAAFDSPENRKILATAFDAMAADDTVVARLAEKITPVQGFRNHQTYVRTRLIKLGIVYDAEDANRWRSFFGPALDNIALDQPLTFMYDHVELSEMPAQVIIDNNIVMLRRLQTLLEEGLDIIAPLKEIIYRSDADQLNFTEQTNKLLEQAMTRAVTARNVDAIVNYVTYEPSIAIAHAEKIGDIVISALTEAWQKNEFTRMEKLAEFLTGTLRVNFSLEVKLSEMFSEYLASKEVMDQLASSTPKDLLRTIEQARINLNPKLEYVKKRFTNRPEIVQSRLRAAAVNASGPYGTANALLAMYDELDKADRDKHLTTAIKLGVSNDKAISASELAAIGSELVERWKPEITYNFIINESLNRIKDLDDARKAWKAGSDRFRDNAEKLRPQIASLMRGIDAFEAGNMQEAASRFMVITDPAYVRAAEPYLKEFRDTVSKAVGTYIHTRLDDNLRVAVIELAAGSELLKVTLNMTSAVGMVEVNENFVVDKGRSYKTRLIGDLNPETLELSIPLDQQLGQVDDIPVARAFGRIKSIGMEKDQLVVKAEGDEKAYVFRRLSDKVGVPLRPSGRFGITRQLSTNDVNTDHVLPVGSILNITTADSIVQRNIEDRGTSSLISVYPVTGTILHPSTPQPIDVEGYYNPDKHTTELTYSYPMNDGRTVLDAIVRCNILDTRLICGAHNRHWSRQRYSHVVEGLKAK
jgi:hypothetical protein